MKTKKHYGFAIVRALMCFVVVLCHFWETPTRFAMVNYFVYLKPLAVPVFMLTSFFLMGRSFFDVQPVKMRRRMFRLVWPQVAWAILYWIILFPLHQASATSLFWQILTGHSPQLNATMWFQTAMILLTGLFWLVFYCMETKKAIATLSLLGVLALAFQYCGLNYSLFANLRYELSYPLGRMAEVLPYAVLGVCFAYFDAESHFYKHQGLTVVFTSLLVVLAIWLEKRVPLSVPGFGYSGIYLLSKGIAIFAIAAAFPLRNLPGTIAKVLDIITGYTLGIYCMHRLIERILFMTPVGNRICEYFGIGNRSFMMCIVIYVICYICSALMAQIPLKKVKQLVL